MFLALCMCQRKAHLSISHAVSSHLLFTFYLLVFMRGVSPICNHLFSGNVFVFTKVVPDRTTLLLDLTWSFAFEKTMMKSFLHVIFAVEIFPFKAHTFGPRSNWEAILHY